MPIVARTAAVRSTGLKTPLGLPIAAWLLSTYPAADQPMCDEAAGLAIIFNGEIYNYRELRAELVCDGYGFRTQSDTEVLLRLYARDGEAMLARLNGIFAFAIWDAGKRELFLARDGLGVKPLYYAQTAQGFLFASEITGGSLIE